jgi:hypothetical protein
MLPFFFFQIIFTPTPLPTSPSAVSFSYKIHNLCFSFSIKLSTQWMTIILVWRHGQKEDQQSGTHPHHTMDRQIKSGFPLVKHNPWLTIPGTTSAGFTFPYPQDEIGNLRGSRPSLSSNQRNVNLTWRFTLKTTLRDRPPHPYRTIQIFCPSDRFSSSLTQYPVEDART